MKKLLLMAFAALAGLAFGQGDDDVSVVFSTEGPDRYMDGSVVLDGECYALVWSTDGVFEGFSADGAALDLAEQQTFKMGAVRPFEDDLPVFAKNDLFHIINFPILLFQHPILPAERPSGW